MAESLLSNELDLDVEESAEPSKNAKNPDAVRASAALKNKADDANDYYTPDWVAEIGRRAMGGIELDPASCEEANRVIRADHYFTREDDGLAQEWYGKVWLNPPYLGGNKTAFIKKLLSEPKVTAWAVLTTLTDNTATYAAMRICRWMVHFHKFSFRRPGGDMEQVGMHPFVLILGGDISDDPERWCTPQNVEALMRGHPVPTAGTTLFDV